MILRPLAKIHSRGSILKIGDREIPFETREEYVNEDDDDPERERCIGPDGFEAEHETAFLEHFGIPAPWNRETGIVDGKEVSFFPAGPPDADPHATAADRHRPRGGPAGRSWPPPGDPRPRPRSGCGPTG